MDDSDSEEEDSDGEMLTPGVDIQIHKTLMAIRRKDQSVYDKNTRFFEAPSEGSDDGGESDSESGAEDGKKKKKKKEKVVCVYVYIL